MQINRLFEIIYILLDKKTVTAKELSERFRVSTRTIYRDIDVLSSSGIPVYMTKGKGGGISLLSEYVLNKALLTHSEANDLITSLKAINTIEETKAESALTKLSSIFGEEKANWIEIDFSNWGGSNSEGKKFNEIKAAIIDKKIIEFNYSNLKGNTIKREVEPLKLCFKAGSWYLYAYCLFRGDFRFFKLKRIKKLSILEKSFNRIIPLKVLKSEDIFSDEFITLKLKISKNMAYRVYDEFNEYEILNDGNFIGTINYPKGQWVYYYIFSFGEDCEVIEPLYIREEVKEKVKKILENYN